MPQDAPRAGYTVLVVEDQDAVRRLTTRILERAGFAVVAVPSSADALSLSRARREGFDLILTDVRMPGMNGIELATTIRADRPDQPIVLVSGNLGDVDVPAALDPIGRLAKPFRAEDVARAATAAIDGRAFARV